MGEPSLPAVVLCGGLGTRLRPVLADRPKALAEVAGRPFLGHLLDHLRREGVREVVLSAGHLSDQIEAYVGDHPWPDLAVRTVAEEAPLGTGGALRFAAHAAGLEGPFFALNGDTYFTGSLRALAAGHRLHGAPLTMALARVPEVARFGAVALDPATGEVRGFSEKGAAGGGWINAGTYVIAPEALSELRVGQAASLERDVLPALVGRGLHAVAFSDATFLDIGTPADLARAPLLLPPAPSP